MAKSKIEVDLKVNTKEATAQFAELREAALVGIGEILDEMTKVFAIKDRGQRTAQIQELRAKLNTLKEGMK